MGRRVRQDRLARWCQRVERWEGDEVRAAARLGVSRTTFRRLRDGEGGATLQDRTARRLAAYRPPVATGEEARWHTALAAAIAYAPMSPEDRHHWAARQGPRALADAGLLAQLRASYPRPFGPLDRLAPLTPPDRFAQAELDIAAPLRDIIPRARIVLRSEGQRLTVARLSLPHAVGPTVGRYLHAAVASQCRLLDLERARAAAIRAEGEHMEQQLREGKTTRG